MSFGGGGGGALPNHEHTNIALDGGPLDFVNTTIASMNAGSTTFSDGNALQELVIGTPAQALVVNGAGTAPEWATSAAVGGNGVNVQDQGNFTTSSATAVDVTNYSLTLPTTTAQSDDCICVFSGVMTNSVSDAFNFELVKNTTAIASSTCEPTTPFGHNSVVVANTICDADGDTLKLTLHSAGGNSCTFKSGTDTTSGMSVFAV